MTATPVAPVSTHPSSVQAVCPVCGHTATWQVGPDIRSCTGHVGEVLAQLYRDEPHPFHPHLPVPLRRGKW